MKKTLYSLMLSDDVVNEIDILAHRRGTNRSALVNEILAEYANLMTPERRVEEIFRQIGELLGSDRQLVPTVTPNAPTMSMRSSLQYRYRPTVKYSVELYRDGRGTLGQLSVVFRTQSAQLLTAMDEFFRLWKRIEDELVAPYLQQDIEYSLYAGRFTRTLNLPRTRDWSTTDVADAITAYVRLFDGLMKDYLGGLSPAGVRTRYLEWLHQGNTVL